MEKLSVSKEFVLAAHNAACDTWKSKIRDEFPDLFTSKHDLGKWYKIISGGSGAFCADGRIGRLINKPETEGKHNGWCYDQGGLWFDTDCGIFHVSYKADLQLLTKEEIEKHLIALAEKKGLVHGAKYWSPKKRFERVVNYPLHLGHNYELVCANGDMLTQDGHWAEIIQEPVIVEITMDEIAKLKGCDVSQLKIKK